MPQFIKCNTCEGFKRLPGLGGIQKECHECKGVGVVEIKQILEPFMHETVSKIDRRKKSEK